MNFLSLLAMGSGHNQGQQGREPQKLDNAFNKLKDFFPSMTPDIIMDVLLLNDGALEPSIDHLLQLASSESDLLKASESGQSRAKTWDEKEDEKSPPPSP
eukprot:CAMPEP_0198206080 /NCGR_PEP_ID=MMETSP1445-20131203/9602_1 /TAXON_ID=36898 /ORGANISM="Pyramimonas sp., Strain CCMP2087" /LENGTH=99 /DNA_ID=CAMNT_0043878621 /DNA_START=52 /DNA_END=347 /DNA_ORIENTATION=+